MAIPEPETYALMLAGLALVGFIGQRKTAENAGQIGAAPTAQIQSPGLSNGFVITIRRLAGKYDDT